MNQCECKKGVFLEALVYIAYIREMHYFFQVCTSKKATNNVEVKVDVQQEKGPGV
jgi:hypothetical protein